ncbi:MAG: ribbon-helix-helix protein, CopG family [Thermoanaerobaculia bacterium]
MKVTYSLDPETIARLERAAERLGLPKSQVVREAISEYSARIDRLSERERLRLLRVFDEMVPAIPERPVEEVEAELAALREARRGGGRRSSPEPGR